MSTVSTVVNEVIVTGRAERMLIDKASKLWQRISKWTHATDVEFEDGKTAQEKVGNINGIATDLCGRNDIAASISAVNIVNEELKYRIGGFRIYRGEDGNIYIIDENAGADAVPKKLGDGDPEIIHYASNGISEYLFMEDMSHVYVLLPFQQDFRLGAGIDIKLPNSENYVNIPLITNDEQNLKDHVIWEDSISGLVVERLHTEYIAANSSGSMFYVVLYLLKNIPAGTMIKKNRNIGTIFK